MADAAKVIRGLEFCLKVACQASSGEKCPYIGSECADGCIYEMQSDALKLLKEQPEIVRCKDCMYNSISDDESIGQCLIQYGWFPARPDWFCADGKKRNDDDD